MDYNAISIEKKVIVKGHACPTSMGK